MVFWPELKSWCRAKVESLFLGSAGTQTKCFLVDHGEHVVVSTDEYVEILSAEINLCRFSLVNVLCLSRTFEVTF